jgi:hypothetical protein
MNAKRKPRAPSRFFWKRFCVVLCLIGVVLGGGWGWHRYQHSQTWYEGFDIKGLEGFDRSTFRILSDEWAKDKNHVYFTPALSGTLIPFPHADPATFQYLGARYLKDKNYGYCGPQRFLIDPSTFTYKDHVAKDKDHVYFCEKKVADADPETFQWVGGSYYKDDDSVYYNDPNDSPDSFEGRIDGASPRSFEYIESGLVSEYYAKDKTHVYHNGSIIPDADAATFQAVGGNYFKDRANVFYYGSHPYFAKIVGRIDGADPATFEHIDANSLLAHYAKDKAHVYLDGVVVPGADPATFVPPKSP